MPSEGQRHQRQVVRQGRQPGHDHHAYARTMTIAGGSPAKASECTRRAYFSAQRAIASISREESWKVVAKLFMLLLCDLCGLARKSISRKLLFSKDQSRSQPRSSCHTLPASAQCAKRVTTGLRLATHLRCIQPPRLAVSSRPPVNSPQSALASLP